MKCALIRIVVTPFNIKHVHSQDKSYLILLSVLILTHWGTGLLVRALRANTRFILKDLYAPYRQKQQTETLVKTIRYSGRVD